MKLEDAIPGEKERAQNALNAIAESARGFYEPQYQIIGSRPYGTFLGLACRCCERWQEYGHKDDCPVRKLTS